MRRRTPCKLEFERVCRTESIFNRRGSHMHATAGSILGPTSAHGLPITPALGGLSSAHKLQPRAPLPFDAIDGSSDNSPKKQCHTGSRLPDTFKHAQPSPQSFVSGNQPAKTAPQQQPAPNTPPRTITVTFTVRQATLLRHFLIRERLHRKSDRLSPSSFLPSIIDSGDHCAPLRG